MKLFQVIGVSFGLKFLFMGLLLSGFANADSKDLLQLPKTTKLQMFELSAEKKNLEFLSRQKKVRLIHVIFLSFLLNSNTIL